jgi:hypothetical protein
MSQDRFGDIIDDVGEFLEDAGEFIEDVGGAIGKIVKAAAPFISMIPGVGTLAGATIYAVGSVAAGDRIDDVAISTVESALPANVRASYRQAIDMGYAVARGENVEEQVLQLAREEARLLGGPQAVAAFDTGIAVGKGRGLQDAGFKLMGAWVQGSTAGERAVVFARDVIEAKKRGKRLDEFLIDSAANQFVESVPAAKQVQALSEAVQYLLDHPDELVEPATRYVKPYLNWQAIAERAGVPVAAVRAAIIIVLQLVDEHIKVEVNTPRRDRILHLASMARMIEAGFTTAERDPLSLNALVAKGQAIINSGATWEDLKTGKVVPLSTIRSGSVWTSTQYYYDSLAGRYTSQRIEVKTDIDNVWRRGFDAGIGTSEGLSQDGPGQQKIRSSLTVLQAQKGFDAAQAIQFDRTKIAETPAEKTANDQYALKGNRIIARGAAWRNRENQVVTLHSIRNGATWRYEVYPEWGGGWREDVINDVWRRGFDIGVGVAEGLSQPGPGQHKAGETLRRSAARNGFIAGQRIQHERSKQLVLQKGIEAMAISATRRVFTAEDIAQLKDLEARGIGISTASPTLMAARALEDSAQFRRGFDIATAGTQGKSVTGPGQIAVRTKLGPTYGGTLDAMRGFDVGQALQHGITKARARGEFPEGNPAQVAGALAVAGLTDSGRSPDDKAAVATSLTGNSDVRSGAVAEIAKKKGFFGKILEFFGL